jgi:hypothetical protein
VSFPSFVPAGGVLRVVPPEPAGLGAGEPLGGADANGPARPDGPDIPGDANPNGAPANVPGDPPPMPPCAEPTSGSTSPGACAIRSPGRPVRIPASGSTGADSEAVSTRDRRGSTVLARGASSNTIDFTWRSRAGAGAHSTGTRRMRTGWAAAVPGVGAAVAGPAAAAAGFGRFAVAGLTALGGRGFAVGAADPVGAVALRVPASTATLATGAAAFAIGAAARGRGA